MSPPGGYIAFLDADDKWESDFFCDRIMALIKRGYSCLGFQSCHCDSSMLWRDVPYELNAGMHLGGKDIVWTHSAQHFGAMLYSCQLLREYEIRFIEGLKYTEDKIFRMQCMYLAKQVWLENQLLYYYRATPDSAIHKRKHGIEHFTPIIEGWLTSDHTMQRWKNAARGQLCAGRELASIYVMDMISEHYQCFRTAKDITRLLQEKPYYQTLLDGSNEIGIPVSKSYQYMLNHPIVFKLKNYIKGCTFYAGKLLIQIPLVKKIRHKQRYPVQI